MGEPLRSKEQIARRLWLKVGLLAVFTGLLVIAVGIWGSPIRAVYEMLSEHAAIR
jgi:hypothetical protein